MTALLMATALMTQRKLFSRSCAEMVFNGEGGERESEEKVEVDGGGERAGGSVMMEGVSDRAP